MREQDTSRSSRASAAPDPNSHHDPNDSTVPPGNALATALGMLVVFTILCGLVYPLAITGAAQVAFPAQANGSLVVRDGAVVGSSLIGQPFTAPGYFWSRPSATAVAYDGTSSGASNLGPSNRALHTAVADRVAALRAADPGNTAPVPIDLVTTSGSGLDPDISPAAAYYQAPRVARARGLDGPTVRALIDRHVLGRVIGILGDPHVNVLALNLDLDALVAGKR
ncbi:MAG: potassium-transporting ATPase subunit KdpC [Deltaproteobacteria bacterium]|nr:potassium-transporting ATPase subunit KdpC [Deltaproteobacteria bacterium]